MADARGTASPRGEAGIESVLEEGRALVDGALDDLLPHEDTPPSTLHRAMRYSVFAGGKRLRPMLLLAAGRTCGADDETLLPAACAVEMIHTYSLIHDDLPAFDDDELRRGSPTSHVVFGEAVAILAGDSLQTRAFGCLADAAARTGTRAPRWLAAIAELADAAGSRGMAGGQCVDVETEGTALDLEALRGLHAAKTGALLAASVRMGGLLAGADDAAMEALTRYGRAVGLAFQIIDDILDIEGSLDDLGKRPGADAHRGKQTYPVLVGVDGARAEARALFQAAEAALEPLGRRAHLLAGLARFVVERGR